jgi:LytS/YehU family sensor histidine kinase
MDHNFFLVFAVLFFSLLLRIASQWRRSEKEKLNAELSYLKAQINPHFLFNTLNSIYALAIEKSDNTATAVAKLSGMMRYVISDAAKRFVPLDKELAYIKDYIELQRIRFGDTIQLYFDINGTANGKQIAPLILISFIENAFKYGVNAEEDSVIGIHMNIEENKLNMRVYNHKVNVQMAHEGKTGTGIANTKTRLDLLYPARHLLTISENEKEFSVSLTLILQ